MVLLLMSPASWAAVSYIDADSNTQTCNTYTVVASGTTTWNSGWYVVNTNVTLNKRVTVNGSVHLILQDNRTLTAFTPLDTEGEYSSGINVAQGNSLTIYGQSAGTGKLTATGSARAAGIGGNEDQAGGNITITGGSVTAQGGEDGIGIGGGYNGVGGNIILSWTNTTDSIYASIYSGTVTASKTFLIDGTDTEITGSVSNLSVINGKTLVPKGQAYVITVSGGNITAPSTAKAGDTVTLTYTGEIPAGYKFSGYSVNGTAIDGNTFTMPKGDVTITATLTPITYTLTYNLNGGTADNPATYTIESADFTLSNPTRKGFTFTGWTRTGLTEATASVTIAKGSTGDREYSAVWTQGGYSPSNENEPDFVYHQLILSGQLNMMFYVYIPDALSPEDCTMDFNVSGDISQNAQSQKYVETITADGYTLYGWQCYVNSVQMADEIHATLHYGDGLTLTHDYTVKTYLELLAGNEALSEDIRELARSIEDLGGYVQPVLAATNGWTVGEKHAKMNPANDFDNTDFENVSNDTAGDAISYTIPDGSGIAKVNYTLLLDAATTLEVYLTPKDDYTGNVSVYVDGGTEDMAGLEDGAYVVRISDIPAHELAKKHTLKVVTGETSFDVVVSAMSYIHEGIRRDDDSMKRAATSIYRYWNANMAFRKNRPDEYKD